MSAEWFNLSSKVSHASHFLRQHPPGANGTSPAPTRECRAAEVLKIFPHRVMVLKAPLANNSIAKLTVEQPKTPKKLLERRNFIPFFFTSFAFSIRECFNSKKKKKKKEFGEADLKAFLNFCFFFGLCFSFVLLHICLLTWLDWWLFFIFCKLIP